MAGESGVGKTAVVDAAVRALPVPARVLWSSCDPLSTPRPLGPLLDIAPDLDPVVARTIDGGAPAHELVHVVFAALRATPTVLVLDDLHWADEGTVDLLRFVLRRIDAAPLLVIGTYRDDEVGSSHPVRSLLGDVARSPHGHRLHLEPLSLTAVAELVGDRPVDPVDLHVTTAGNPFFVCEVLRDGGDALPSTIRDAVLARTVGLDDDARDLLDLLACAPEAIPDEALSCLQVGIRPLRDLDRTGLVERGRRGLRFRHELGRLAVASGIPPGGEVALHARMVDALEAVGVADPAVMVHHALAAGDHARVQQYARTAGERASRAGAHTEAARFLQLALDHGPPFAAPDRADVLELLANELFLVDRLADAVATCEQAIALREALGDRRGVGAAHQALAELQWYNGNRRQAEDHARTAVEVLDPAVEPVLLAHAHARQAYLAMHTNDLARARELHATACEVAAGAADRRLTDLLSLIDAALSILEGDLDGRERILAMIERSVEPLDEVHSAGFSNLVYLDVEQRRFDAATQVLEVSLPITVERNIPICNVWQLGSRSRMALLRGAWDDALEDADRVLGRTGAALARTWPLLVRGLVALRRDAADTGDLDEAWDLACRYGEPLRLLPAAAALVERAWLLGPDGDALDLAAATLQRASVAGADWSVGDVAVWLQRAGRDVPTGLQVAPPHARSLAGDHRVAASLWAWLGAPYDEALALVDAADPAAAGAVGTLDRLGADAVADRVRRLLRERGIGAVPGRRRRTTRANTAGLTTRQVEVLELVADGLTNAEIAQRLFISEKTAGHHVSAILTTLGVPSRRAAAAWARSSSVHGRS